LRVVFAGTPAFAARALEAIVASGHQVLAVFTQPDRPAGRGMRMASSAVAHVAEQHGIEVLKPLTLRQGDAESRLRELSPDVMVVAAYGLLLPSAMLQIPLRGCLNIHASVLPRWRGAAPIQRALLAGDAVTGVSIMQMDAGLDTGRVLLDRTVPIGPRETAGALTTALAALGAQAIVETLSRLDTLCPMEQDETRATYASKITKAEARIDWAQPNTVVDRRVRAFNPVPGAQTRFAGEVLKIWEAEPEPGCGAPGEVLVAEGGRLVVACAEGALALMEVQRPGGKRMPVRDFLRGARIVPGALFYAGPAA
jgi:methionyl-tRNA formyltransferase